MKLIEFIQEAKNPKYNGSPGAQLVESIMNIPMNKSTAIQILALRTAIDKASKNAKEYLLSLPSSGSGVFQDPSTKLTITAIDAVRKTYKSERIDELKRLIKEEEQKIENGETPGEIIQKPYVRFNLITKEKTSKTILNEGNNT